MPSIVADRFVASGASWIDLASGESIALRVVGAIGRDDQFAWSERCAVLAKLRHPAINPLLDYGALDASRLFEAYAALAPLPVAASGRQRLFADTTRFLHSHGIAVMAETAPALWRPVIATTAHRGRSFGVTLQPRLLLTSLEDVLDAAAPAGPALIHVVGPPHSGVRTVRMLTARAARLRGYVPVCPEALAAMPRLADELTDRHVCLLTGDRLPDDLRGVVAELLSRLGRRSTRRHIVITFARSAPAAWNVLRLDPMGVTAMTSMVFLDRHNVTPTELFDAARGADGRPGLFLERLRACGFEPHKARSSFAHETAQVYDVTPTPLGAGRAALVPSTTRPGVLARAPTRAEALARRGRHAAAMRLLHRAARVLAGRGEIEDAARCSECLGRLHLERGRVAAAIEAFEQVRVRVSGSIVARQAALGLATAWIDDARLSEAEALLRSLAVAGELQQATDHAAACALGRSLFWQGRYSEALAVLQSSLETVLARATAARVHLALKEEPLALRLARSAVQSVDAQTPPATVVVAHRVLALALAASGDGVAARDQVDLAIRSAVGAHLPIAALRARLTQVHVLDDPQAANRLASRLATLGRRDALPRLLRLQIAHAVEETAGTGSAAALQARYGVRIPLVTPVGRTRHAAVADLEALLDVCHAAGDDRQALDRLCAAIVDRLRAATAVVLAAHDRRTVGHCGKPWTGLPLAARILTAAGGVPADTDGLCEAGEPVKYGGEVIGVVACRWTPGTAVVPERASIVLKAAALAASASVRAVTDRAAAVPADAGWPDLLGQSAATVALRAATTRAARSPFPVLIEGESGSGKELVARAIHRLSPRRDRRLCAVNCAALTDDLLEAELFGHTRGAFTGAVGERVGLFEEADGGTLFLDEIGELSPRGQAKLLRALQEGEIRRLGESFARKVDVRIVAATNRRLEDEAAAGRFRHDLRFRLDVVRIVVPPLRDRPEDIALLAAVFWEDATRRVGSRATLAPETLAALSRYDWPGNVRELQNVIAWMAVHSPHRGRVGASGVPAGIANALPGGGTFETAREEFERRFVRTALARANGNRCKAAQSIGLTRQGLAKIMRRLDIDGGTFA